MFVYLLMVVNYQNFGDPFVVILALPATFCGILTMLFVTGTTLNVPSLMGAIMAVGVASANSILLVTFAREQQLAGKTAFEAAIDAGHTRIRPVLMTAAAMIVGMIPMAIGGAGEEQNAALARAVIGGLLFATPTTLLVVPYLFAMLRQAATTASRPTAYSTRDTRMNDVQSLRSAVRARKRSRAAGEPPAHRQRRRGADRAAGCLGSVCSSCSPARSAFGAWRYYWQHQRRRRGLRAASRLRAERPRGGGAGERRHRARHLAGHHLGVCAANIYARASGYIDKRNVDIGDRVKEGQLLAQITAPELDHQIAQAEATLVQSGSRAASAGEQGSRAGDLEPRQPAGRARAG